MSNLADWVPLPHSWRELAWKTHGAVLLESTLPSLDQHRSFFFSEPLLFLTANSPEDMPAFFHAVQTALEQGLHVAGYMTYEAGAVLQRVPAHNVQDGACLAKFGVYCEPTVFDHLQAVTKTEVSTADAHIGPLPLAMLPLLAQEDYVERIRQVQDWIAQGGTYQVNFTTAVQSRFDGDGLHMYERLTLEQPCSYGAMVRIDEERTILSFSPELFFQTSAAGQIVTRPMKGTAPRCTDKSADDQAAVDLSLDEKNRAEHVMIVDLLRNDLGRICKTGSIRVDDLFHVEPYPTVHQMVSTVSGQLQTNVDWKDIFTSLFPSGSITGAPKRRTMELIHELEDAPRGVYTGAIGYMAPTGESAFSVAIRTLMLQSTPAGNVATMGVGGGIVADSQPEEEWQECLLKASFLHRGSVDLKLIETMRADGDTIADVQLHLLRLQQSAHALGFSLNMDDVHGSIARCLQRQECTPKRLRLTLSRDGVVEVESEALQAWPSSLRVRVSAQHTKRDDPSLRYKTTFRQIYDEAFSAAKQDGFDEAIFLNAEAEPTEGCVTNLIVCGENGMRTPALACGVLPGVFRQTLVRGGIIQESVLHLKDLGEAEAVFLCNSVRGLVAVQSITMPTGDCLQFDEGTAFGIRDNILHRLAASQTTV